MTIYGGKGDGAQAVDKEVGSWTWRGKEGKEEALSAGPNAYLSLSSPLPQVGEGDVISVGQLQVRVLETPCHTPGHVCFVIDPIGSEAGHVFTGDTYVGCRRITLAPPCIVGRKM